jgi:glycerol kinase
MTSHLLAIDQGTTSSRATVFRADYTVAAIAQQEIPQHFPQSSWVEHDPEDWWRTVVATGREAIAMAGLAARDFAAIGITNQRETMPVWDRTAASRSTTMQRLADILGAPVVLGAAYLAGLQSGLCSDPPAFGAGWALDRRFTAAMDETTRSRKIAAGSTPSAACWAATTLRARHRLPAVHFIGGLMRAGRRTYVSVGAVGDLPFCSGALSSPSVER